MILDVGCGDHPQGTLNVDLYRYTTHARDQKRLTKTKADIIADGNYLPFQDNIFTTVIATQVIEHTDTPFRFLRELIRVSHSLIQIACPHRYSGSAKLPHHVSYFNRSWFARASHFLKVTMNIETTYEYLKIGKLILPIMRTKDLHVKLRKCL